MRFVKCPRCELNYIPEDEEYCPVCKREMKGERQEELYELCSICNENPVMPGKDICFECYKEMHQQTGLDSESEDLAVEEEVEIGMEDVTDMEELEMETIPDDDSAGLEQLSLEEEQTKELDDDDPSEYVDE